jgi:hypothetical protein
MFCDADTDTCATEQVHVGGDAQQTDGTTASYRHNSAARAHSVGRSRSHSGLCMSYPGVPGKLDPVQRAALATGSFDTSQHVRYVVAAAS